MSDEGSNILFVDDDPNLRTVVSIALSRDGHRVDAADSGDAALELFLSKSYDLVIQDVRMPGMNGLELLRRLVDSAPEVPVLVMTAFSSWNIAVEAMRLGAFDYIKKPFDNNDLRQLAKRAIAYAAAGGGRHDTSMVRMIGTSGRMKDVQDVIRRVARTDSTVLIQGESGTGKELVAARIHAQSHRKDGPFVAVNCGGFSETLLESELFGHIKGAFTGAVSDKKGLLQLADGGTFFLDEVGETTLSTQVRLLRVLETKTFLPVGGETARQVDVRFVAATNRNLADMAQNGSFREDLYYRLNVIPIQVPPLRERRDDIPMLAGHFLSIYSGRFDKRITGFTPKAMDAILSYDWPGNVRELQNAVQRAISLAEGELVEFADIFPSWSPKLASINAASSPPGGGEKAAAISWPPSSPPAMRSGGDPEPAPPAADLIDMEIAPASLESSGFDLESRMEDIERGYIREALAKSGNSITRAAEMLGISFRSMRYKIKKLKLDR